ncbi:MAG: hypothetical protein AAF602_06210 [Myxococcota bacterium]
MPAWSLMVGLALSAPARAACPETVALDTVLARSLGVEEALQTGRNLDARDEARRLREALPCLVERLPDPETTARVARAVGSGYVASGEMALGKPWLRSAVDLGEHTWPLPDDHPVVEVWRQVANEPRPAPVSTTEQAFVDVAFLDGSPIDAPVARPDRPHLLQLGEGPVDTYVVFGAQFPSDVLGDGSGGRRRDRTAKTRTRIRTGDEPLVVDRVRPPEKTPLLVSGAAMVVVAGGLYGLAAQRRTRFDDPTVATSLDELTGLRNQVNGLVIASAATFGLGVSGAVWGSLLDGGGTATLRVRF